MCPQGMVCFLEEGFARCVVRDQTGNGQEKITLDFPSSSTVLQLFQEVGKRLQYHHETFELILSCSKDEDEVILNDKKLETLEKAGLKCGPGSKNNLVCVSLKGISVQRTNVADEDSQLESTSSPTAYGDYGAPPAPPPLPPPPPASTSSSGDYTYSLSIIRQDSNKSSGSRYVGLVNQAMTCYLNSLLQALFMTPEFRNALYNWEFDESQSDESKSIPYQLQKLFLNLQTSHKSAVETTELTRSFGWDSSEAWQQHDIQELCRVMFDALEQKFKNTEQADLINRLYEGKMIDYVKCLECSTEKSREDTFLDIPLPVRPFGSTVAYGSVEEALRAFVQPETLEGNNQYHCETCNKKCDAHKGLKFSKFPYLLTLHLKRFDFDYSTLHRIKLNDKVSFPEKLNLNSFVAHTKGEEANSESTPEEVIVKCDDSSTTDSGSALDDEGCQGIDTVSVPNSNENHNVDYQEDDEGIDVSQMHEIEKNRQNMSESGPYIYELFSIMIHSGSAAGGHYYAYIKDFRDGEWYCFNDQNVTKITHEDIRKTYGGGPIRAYYSGAYSSSTNAYMLMYRQVDGERNANAMTVDEFPPHIKKLHKKLEEQKEMESRIRERKMDLCKLKLYCHHPTQNVVGETKLYLREECTLKEATQEAYRRLNLEKIVPIERCRLVSYDRTKDLIECSFEGRDEDTIGEIFQNHKNEFLMEIRKEDEEFEVYKPGNINTKVLLVNLETEEVKGPIIVRGNLSETVKEYKESLAKQLNLPGDSIHIVLEKYSQDPRLLQSDDATLKSEGFYGSSKIYVATALDDEDSQKPLISSKLHRIIDRFEHVITLNVSLPNVDSETLEKLNIPPLDQCQSSSGSRQNEDLLVTSPSRGASPNERDPSPQPLPDPEDECLGPAGPYSDQSASEDSSLTDSERTIVGEAPGDCLAQLSPSNSPVGSDQNVSSPENDSEFKRETSDQQKFRACKLVPWRSKKTVVNTLPQNEEDSNWDGIWDPECSTTSTSRGRISNYDYDDSTTRISFNCYFKATPYTDSASNQKMLKIMVDKRMIQKTLKQCLEPYVGVSVDHFKLYRTYNGSSDIEFARPTESLNIFRDDEKLTVKLGRALKKGETVGNVFLLAPNSPEPVKFLCEWIIANGSSVGQVKKEILEEIKRKCAIDIPYNQCRLRKKNWKNPTRPYLDDQTFDDFISNWELFVQELPEEEPVTRTDQKLLFVRQWCPATLELKPFQEIVLDSNLTSECKEKISQLSDIPAENIDIAKGQGSFPCNDISILGIHSDLDWNPATKVLDGWPLNIYDDGHVIFYRDNREKIKQLSIDERKEIISKENRGKLGSTSTSVFSYSPRKEKALKIYLDSTPPGDRRKEVRNESDVD